VRPTSPEPDDTGGAAAAHVVSRETLALLALGEPAATAADEAHLLDCPECRAEIDALARAADIGRASFGSAPLESPSAQVWQRISASLEFEQPQLRPRGTRRRALGRPRRRVVVAALSSLAAVALVATTVTVWRTLEPSAPGDSVVARATLAGLPAWPGARGEAVVEDLPDGGRVVRLTLDAAAAGGDYREAWLLTRDASSLVSLGLVAGEESTFAIPADLDLAEYDVVDVSSEPYDGDPLHSGDSIVRGRLTGG
jgi:anti-sigma-K factor RskA